MKLFRIKVAAILIAILGLVAVPLSGVALAASKVALVLDVGGGAIFHLMIWDLKAQTKLSRSSA